MSYFYFDLFTRNRQLTLTLDEAQGFKKELQDELARMDALQETLRKENEQLKKESLAYLTHEKDINDKRQQLEKIIKQQSQEIKDSKRKLQAIQKELQALKQENLKLADINTFAGNVRIEKQEKEIVRLKNELSGIKARMKKQAAFLHYNLGVSYTKDKNYELAIDEYEKALSLNPDDADTHYNLAILYDDYRNNPKRAIEHYKKYLELKPDAADIDEVKDWIEHLALGEPKIKGVAPEETSAATTTPGEKIKGMFLKKVEEIPQR